MNNVELPFVKDMFDKIAPRYDFLNRFLSLRQDIFWRKIMVSAMKLPFDGTVLDVACGTGDVALEIIKQKGMQVKVKATDFSPKMLWIGKSKVFKQKLDNNISFLGGNALSLPFKDQAFDAVTIAFGIRNIADKLSCLKSFYRVIKPGGMVFILELTTPEQGLFRNIYLFYFQRLLPVIGGFFSKNLKAYQYLPESVLKFPDSKTFVSIMKKAGFKDIKWKIMTFGIVSLYVGIKKKT